MNKEEKQNIIKCMILAERDIIEIMKATSCARGTLWRWIHEMNLPYNKEKYQQFTKGSRINKLQDNRYDYQRKGREIAKNKDPLHMMGCMLYWAEGSKTENTMQFVNSDVHMLKIFSKFLHTYFPDKHVKLQINYYQTSDNSYQEIEKYWAEEIGHELLHYTFMKPTVRNKYYTLPEIIKYPYGILRLNINAVDVIHHIYGAIQEYTNTTIDKFSPIVGSTQ
jgi:hypothetical protein